MYRRTTREVSLSSLPAPIASALAEHARAHQLSLEGARLWLTHSENPVAEGFFGKMLGRRANPSDPDAAHDTVLLLQATHLLVATHGEVRGTAVLSLPLLSASLSRGPAALAALGGSAAADGVFVEGFPGEIGRPGTYFVGLGSEPAAEACRTALTDAITRAKSPS